MIRVNYLFISVMLCIILSGSYCHAQYDDLLLQENPDWTDNLSLFIGLDGSKQPQDVGVNAHFGGRVAVNLGIPIYEEAGIGLQVGTALTATDAAVQVLEALDGTDSRVQNFTTIGLFQVTDAGHHWGIVWDHLYENYYDDINLDQLRGRAAWQLNDQNQVGLSGSWSLQSKQNARVAGTTVVLSPINQVAAFWRHEWATGVQTEGWLGLTDTHGEVVHVFAGSPRRTVSPLFGAMINVPLNDHWAIYGQGNFIAPADSGTVDAYFGFTYHFGKSNPRKSKYQPILDVAGNTSFAVDLRR